MSQTLRQVLSDLSSDINALNIDDRKSFRWLASKFKDKVQVFIRQDARSRELVRDSNIWKPINCVKLDEIKAIDCCDIEDAGTFRQSKVKIPEAYSTSYGNLVKVFTLNGSVEFKEIKSFEYKDFVNREYGSGKYFWFVGRKIIIPDSTVESVKVLIIAKNPLDVDLLNNDCNKCKSILDAELNYPDYLISAAKQAVLQELSGVTARIVPDEKPNENLNEKT